MESVNKSLKAQLILEVSEYLTETDSSVIKDAIVKFLGKFSSLIETNRAILFWIDAGGEEFTADFEWYSEDSNPLKRSLKNLRFDQYALWEKFAHDRAPLQITDTENIPDSYTSCKKLLNAMEAKAFLQIPLLHQNKLVGFLSFSKNKKGKSWDEQDIEFGRTISELLVFLKMKIKQGDNGYESSKSFDIGSKALPFQPKGEAFFNDRKLNKNILESLNHGIAIFDTQTERFIYSNRKCADLLNIKKRSLPDKEKIFRLFKDNGYKTSDFFRFDEKITTKDFSLYFEQKHLSGTIIPVAETEWVSLNLYDITPIIKYEENEKTLGKQLRTLSEAAIKLLSIKDEDIYKFIGDTAHLLQNDAIVCVTSYEKQDGYLKPRYIKGISNSWDKIINLLGKHPLNKKFPLDPKSDLYNEISSSRVKEIKGGVLELSLYTLSKPVAIKIEKILKIKKFYGCGLFSDGNLYGTIAILLPEDSFIHPFIFETFSQLASNGMHALRMKQKLESTKTALWNAAAIARLGYWQYEFCSRTITIDKGLLKDFNDQESDEKISMPLERFLNRYAGEEDKRKILEKFRKAAENLKNENYTADFEWKFIRKNEPPLHLYTRGVMKKGGIITGIAQDISAIREAEQNLWESERKFKNLIQQSLDPIIVIQDDGTITEWNSSAEKNSGINAEDAIGKFIWDVESEITFKPAEKEDFIEYPKEKFKENFFRYFEEDEAKKPVSKDISVKTNYGDILHLTVTSFVFIDSNRKYLCRIFKDVTLEKEKQEREKQLEIKARAEKAKELFLDNMNHEMRTPLSGIIGMTDILLRTGLNEHQTELLKVLKESSDSLLELISNIHELSTIESEGIIIRRNRFSLNELLDKSLGIFRASAMQKEIALDSQINADDEIFLLGDEFRLQQILTNLIANAIKFTPSRGEVKVITEVESIPGSQANLRITVKDTGIGIPKDKIPILFDKFTQADSSYTREHEGAGIGLAICKELTEMMGGQIGVYSESEKGASFWIRLTLPKA